ncbi:MAG: tyrosine-type recombinase/integrase [Verrucomicrobia bacterium]|nr:tyrosine-type recombinase/integrase [Verrucomicrobiota bacterium]
MAFLRRFPRSPYWFAGFTLPDGRRVQRSTKQSNRKKAQSVADAWEKAAKLGAEKRFGEAQARRVVGEIYETVNNEPLPSKTAREFLTDWAEGRKNDTAPRTQQAYAQVVRDFVICIGERADRDISQVSRSDVAKYRDLVAKRTSIATANKSLKYLRVALGAAWKDGLSQDNVAAKLDTLKRRSDERAERRPFTIDELKTLLSHASPEWRGLILFGLYTGQRLKDLARLTWSNLDLVKGELRFVTGKTGRRMHLPLAAPLVQHLGTMKAGDNPTAPLFPSSAIIANNAAGDSRLSQQFHAILVDAGMAKERSKKETGKGRSRRRTVNAISFHSLRHTATSLLKNAGVSEAIAMDIIGHDSKAISRHYTHIDEVAKRAAFDKLPDITSA